MIESFKQFLSEIRVLWGNVGVNQKIALGVLLAAFVGALVFWGSWNRREDFGLLFKGLEPKDAAEIVNVLKADNVSCRIEDGGTAILVPSEKVYDLRLKLASQGLPHEEAGWELFDQNSLGSLSDFVQKVNHTRALQAELERTISRVKQVEWAKVHIVEAKDSVFTEVAQPATASVLMKMRGGAALAEGQVAGITHLIAGAVRGLTAGNVTITDHTGRQLSRPAGSDTASAASNQLDYRREVEEHLSSRATQMLERVLGPGRAIVTVSADIDFTNTESRTIDYKDKITKRTKETTRESTGSGASGEAGVAGNVAPAAPGAGTSTSTTREEETEYAAPIPMKEQKQVQPGGKINRLAAAVFVCAGDYRTTKAADGTETRQYVEAPKAKLKDYENIVKNAIGFEETRDTVAVSDGEFRSTSALPPDQLRQIAEENNRQFIVALVKSGSTALGVLLFLFFARRVLKKAFAAAPAQPAAASATVGALDAVSVPEREEPKTMTLKDQVLSSVREDPSRATQHLRAWMYK